VNSRGESIVDIHREVIAAPMNGKVGIGGERRSTQRPSL